MKNLAKRTVALWLFLGLFVIGLSLAKTVCLAAKELSPIEGNLSRFVVDPTNKDITSTAQTVNDIVSIAMGILTIVGGSMFLVMFVLGGIRWLSSSGKPENLDKAKNQLTYSVIGLIIVVAAYGLSYIVGSIFKIDVLNPGDYIFYLMPNTYESYIGGLSPELHPIDPTADPSSQVGDYTAGKLNTLFTIFLGTITLFGGLFFIIYFLFGALQWLTSNGLPDRLEKAKKQISAAVIGMIVVVAAYAISFIVGSVLGVDILNPGNTFYKLKNMPIARESPACLSFGSPCTTDGIPCCNTEFGEQVFCLENRCKGMAE